MSIHIDNNQKRAARIAGAITAGTILFLFPLMALVQTKIFNSPDMSVNIQNLLNNEVLFRVSTFFEAAMYVSVAVLAWAFYVILRPVDATYAMLGLVLRVAEAMLGVMGVVVGFTILATALNGGGGVEAAVGVLRSVQDVVNKLIPIFLSTASIVFYLLFMKSRYMPKGLAVAGIIAYAVVLLNAGIFMLVPDAPAFITGILALPVVVFEFVIGLWLLFWFGKSNTSQA